MSSYDPSEWARKRKMQVARAKAIREQRLRQQRALQQALQKEEDVKSSAPASSKHNQKLPLASPGLDLRAIQGTPAGSHGGNSALSLQEVLDQSLKSMNSLEKLSQMHERQFSGRREATAQTPVRRKSSRSRSHQPPPSSSALSSVPRNHAARAHERNDRYMSDWHDAYNHMNGDSYKWGGGPPSASSRASKSGGSVSSASRPSSGSRRRNRKKVTRPPRKEVATRVGRRNTGGQSLKVVQGGMSQMTLKSGGGGWSSEPDDSKAIEIKSSGRPILCMSVMEDEAVVGSSDHALYAYDLSSGVQTRQMFDKRNGHREWVSCVAHTHDGRTVSGGMDSRLLLWGARGASCHEFRGHTGSISAVGCTSSSSSKPLVISASYDKTVRAFDLRSRRQLLCFSGHKGPVLSLDWAASGLALSGGRGGIAIAWDLQAGGPVGMLKGHKGHVTVVRWLQQSRSGGTGSSSGEASVFMTGAQDGHVRIWDLRSRGEIANISAHTSQRGAGAIAGIEVSASGNTIVSAGADRAVCMLDVRAGFKLRHRATDHKDFIYELKTVGENAISGGGDGSVYCHSTLEDKVQWNVRPLTNAVRCIGCTENRLVVAGDDGSAVIYKF